MGTTCNNLKPDWRSDAIAPGPEWADRSKRYQLMLETVDVSAPNAWNYMTKVVLGWRPWLRKTMGARMITANTQLTGRPGQLVHLWEVPWEFSLAEMHARVYEAADRKGGAWLRDLQSYAASASYELLVPTEIDPMRVWDGRGLVDDKTKQVGTSRLFDIITPFPGQLAALVSIKKRRFQPEAKHFGITLLASGTLVTGPTRKLYQFWNLTRDDAVGTAMRAFSEQSWYQSMHRNTIEAEDQTVLLPMRWYDPSPSAAPRSAHSAVPTASSSPSTQAHS